MDPRRDTLKADASPSISLEKGGYRMRGPRLAYPVIPLNYNRTPKRRKPQDQANRNLALLLALLTTASIACFAYAYYLYTSRWEDILWKDGFAQTNRPVEAFAVGRRRTPDQTTLSPSQKYLSYLPHSGFNNQRIALENALALARFLNRTLLVPPIRFGVKAIRYLPFNTLSNSLQLAVNEGLEHCGSIPPYITLPGECLDFADSATLPWQDLFDLSQIEKEQEVIHLHTLSPSDYLSLLSPGVLQIRDEAAYHFRFTDEMGHTFPLASSKYDQVIALAELSKEPRALIQLGTLFGTNRLLLGSERAALLGSIREKMVVRHEILDAIADSIFSQLPYPYIGLHLRLADGDFSDRRDETIQESWCLLMQRIGCTAENIRGVFQASGAWFSSNACSHVLNGVVTTSSSPAASGPECGLSHRFTLTTPVFIGTDLKHPGSNRLLLSFRQTFPSTFFLSDFQHELDPLERIQSSDGVELGRFLAPIVEAMIIARAKFVVGTRGSTFSKFIENTLWPAYQKISPRPRA